MTVGVGALAQEEDAQTPSYPTVSVTMVDPGGAVSLSASLTGAGPLFALPTIAARLGLELRIGPLGESHTLVLEDRTVIVGPMATLAVVSDSDGEDSMLGLSRPAIRTAAGLEVPLDFLERTIGDALGVDFDWDAAGRRLYVGRRELRDLEGRLLLVRQGPATTLQATLSEAPRYRVHRQPGSVEIRWVGDRVTWGAFTPDDDPLVLAIETTPNTLRLVLAEDAAVAEPRLLERPPRLVIEVYRRRPSDPQPLTEGEASARNEVPILESGPRLRTVVLDPGHGGPETGAVKNGLVEKELTLWFARTLRRRLESRMPVRVLLTRERDEDVSLEGRTAFANQNKADLFISLHLNSWFGSGARGAETYFLSREASDERAARSAESENQVLAGDAESDLQLILWDLAQTYHLAESQRFAKIVQEELNDALSMGDRGVKQAPFRVLLGATMPAVVVELGFLSNPDEAAKLQDPLYRSELVGALERAVVRFRQQLLADDEATDAAADEAESDP